jgi:transcriptional regulator with XRE-family HTH domain
MTFGERIVYFRESKGLSQKALAELAGITANRLYYYEKDKREPDVETIKAIASALNITGDDLLGTPWATKKAPAPEGAREKEHILLDETNDLLVELGYIRKGQQLSDADLAFLTHIIGLLDAWFRSDKA